MGKVHGGSIVAIGLLVMIMMRGAGAQAVPSCITPLMKCTDFLRSTNPSADCCNAVKEAVTKDLPCLCSLLLNKNLINQFNMTRVLELPKYCNITASTSLCGQAPQSSPPPVTPGGNNSGHVLSLSVVPALTSLLLFFFTVAMAQ